MIPSQKMTDDGEETRGGRLQIRCAMSAPPLRRFFEFSGPYAASFFARQRLFAGELEIT
jgi:hypothetical protein